MHASTMKIRPLILCSIGNGILFSKERPAVTPIIVVVAKAKVAPTHIAIGSAVLLKGDGKK